MQFTLSARSHFSLGESLLAPDDIATNAKAFGYTAAGLCDTMSVSGVPDFSRACVKSGIKPVCGVRLRVVLDPTYRPPSKASAEKAIPNPAWYPKLYFRTKEGFTRTLALLSKGYSEEYFYKNARIGLKDLLDVLDPKHFVLLYGDFNGVLSAPGYRDTIDAIQAVLGPSNALLEYVINDSTLFTTLNRRALDVAAEKSIPLIVTKPIFYATKAEAETVDVIDAITGREEKSAIWYTPIPHQGYCFMNRPDLVAELGQTIAEQQKREEFTALSKSIVTAAFKDGPNYLIDLIDYAWSKEPVSLPVMAANEVETLKAECRVGWARRFGTKVWDHTPEKADLIERYVPRLKYELATLERMGFAGYFLLVQDLVKWSKEQDILVGPGRGSVGGSLVAYLMGITDVDPIRFDLLFERFINPDRIDLPDADLDFMSTRRHEVIDYLINKYGAERVAGISNYGTLASASALRDVGRVFGIDLKDMGFTKFIPKEHGKPIGLEDAAKVVPDIDKFRLDRPDIWHHAVKLDGVLRSFGRHAAGIVVAGCPLIERAVVESRSGETTVNWDKSIVEDMGLIKMDILGLATLDVFAFAKKFIFKRHGVKVDLINLPLDDEVTLEAFGQGFTNGVFQFESPGMKKLLKDLASRERLSFDDLAAATALYRPGPMDSGLLEQYVQIKKGMADPHYEHPHMEAALTPTLGVIIYQEQVMQIARDVAGFTLIESDHLRKAMGKKDKEKMATFREQWVNGCKTRSGMSAAASEELFDKIEKFAGYGFNRSHAVEYSLISYTSMWLKVNYPAEFFAAAMTVLKEDNLPPLLADCKLHGIHILPPDINLSSGEFEILTDTKLLIPFNRIKGVSDNTTNAILKAREAGPFVSKEEFSKRVERRKCNIGHIGKLDLVGAFARIEEGSVPASDPKRLKDHIELLPGLIEAAVKVDRDMKIDHFGKLKIAKIVEEWKSCSKCALSGGIHPKPFFGKEGRFMVVTDGPTWSEEEQDKITGGDSFKFTSEAMYSNGFTKKDAYFTTLVKSAKPSGDKFYDPTVLKECPFYLAHEIDILKPPIIVALGANAGRFFAPGMKGGAMEHAGKVMYHRGYDATIVFGINPGMCAFDGSKMTVLEEVFGKVKELLS